MKKFVFAVAVLLLAAPAWATTVSCSVDGCDVTVSFSGAGAGPVRGMAFDITVDGDGVISDVVCLSAAHGYQIFPGDISISGAGIVEDYGTCKCSGSYPGTLDASNGMTIEMASLYEDGVDPDPCDEGDLVSFRVSSVSKIGDINVVIAVNTIRGGVVNEDASVELSPTLTGCAVPFEPDTCLNLAAPEFTVWQAWGSPDCWCYQRQCRGDINGQINLNKWVQALDLTLFRAAFNLADVDLALVPNGICADLNHTRNLNKHVQALDLTIFRTYFNQATENVPVCDQAPVITGPYNFWTN